MLASRILFVLYTCLHVWGYIIFVNDDDPSLAAYFIIVVFFIGTYQYLEIYLGIVGLLIVLPFFLIYVIGQAIRDKMKSRRVLKMM